MSEQTQDQADVIEVPADARVEFDDHAVTTFEEDDNPEGLVGEEVDD